MSLPDVTSLHPLCSVGSGPTVHIAAGFDWLRFWQVQLDLGLEEREGGTGDSIPAWFCQPAFGWCDVLRASPVPGLQPRLCLLLPLSQAGSRPPWLGKGEGCWGRVLQHPFCVVLNSELFPYSTTSSHTRRGAARMPEARQRGARLLC